MSTRRKKTSAPSRGAASSRSLEDRARVGGEPGRVPHSGLQSLPGRPRRTSDWIFRDGVRSRRRRRPRHLSGDGDDRGRAGRAETTGGGDVARHRRRLRFRYAAPRAETLTAAPSLGRLEPRRVAEQRRRPASTHRRKSLGAASSTATDSEPGGEEARRLVLPGTRSNRLASGESAAASPIHAARTRNLERRPETTFAKRAMESQYIVCTDYV